MNDDIGLCWVVLNALAYIVTFFISLKFRNPVVSFIYAIYAIASVLGIILYSYDIGDWNITLLPYVYLYVILLILTLPLFKIKIKNIHISKNDVSPFILYILISCCILGSIFYQLPQIKNIKILTIETSQDTYASSKGSIDKSKDVSLNPWTLVRVIIFCILYISGFLFFYMVSLKKNFFLLEVLFLISFLSFLDDLSAGGRGNLILVPLNFILLWCIFRNAVEKKQIVPYLFQFIIIVCVGILFVSIITISRFGERGSVKGENSIIYSLISYGGQSMLNFNAYIFNNDRYRTYGDYTASVIKFICGRKSAMNQYVVEDRWSLDDKNISVRVYITFVGALCLDYGIWWTLALSIVASLLFRKFFNFKDIRLDSLLLLYIYVDIIWIGFYIYRHMFFVNSFRLSFLVGLFFFFRYHIKRRQLFYLKN